MKTTILSLLALCILQQQPFAQVTISTNEFYYAGDVIQMMTADPIGTNAGAAGAGITWDFSVLTGIAGPLTTTVGDNTGGPFPLANLIIRQPNGLQHFILENSADTYLNGIVDTATGTVISYLDYNISKRPMTYMSSYIDTYNVSVTPSGLHGLGVLNSEVDAYGTLITPAGTFGNVLRLKRTVVEVDSIGTTEYTTTTISYLWFDSLHAAPLLRIDSVIGVIGAGNTLLYLAPSLSVRKIAAVQNYQCHWSDNTLHITGDLTPGKNYGVLVYDMLGAVIFNNVFTARSSFARLNISRQVSAGIYMVRIVGKDDPADRGIVKVVKQ